MELLLKERAQLSVWKHFLFFIVLSCFGVAVLSLAVGRAPYSWLAGFLYFAYDTSLIVFVSYSVSKSLRLANGMPSSQRPKKKSLSVLISAHNEKVILPKCLEALLSQSRCPDEIFVVDDGSTDGSFDELKVKFQLQERGGLYCSQKKAHLFVLKKSRSGKANSLNQVLNFATKDILLTLDADTILEKDALEKMAQAFERDSHLRAAGGVLKPVASPGLIANLLGVFQRFEYIRAFLARQAWMNQDALILVSGAFAGYDLALVKAVGSFDSQSLVEDYELTHRLYNYCYERQMPISVGVVSEARATTDCPASLKQFLRQRQRWFGGFLQTFFQYRRMLGNFKFKKVGTLMLPIKSLDALQPLFGLLALYALLQFIVTRQGIHPVILGVLISKLGIDYIYHFYCLVLYNRWQKRQVPLKFWFQSFLISLGEPLLFQPLRHLGAARGWWAYLSKQKPWA